MFNLKFSNIASEGQTIRAYDFKPSSDRPDQFVEGVVLNANNDSQGFAAIKIKVTRDHSDGDDLSEFGLGRVGSVVYVPQEVSTLEWDGRVSVVEDENAKKAELRVKADALEASIGSKTAAEIEESRIAGEELRAEMDELFARGPDGAKLNPEEREHLLKLSNKAGLYTDFSTLRDYRDTLSADLVLVEPEIEYIVVLPGGAKALLSPAGFHPDERVFVKPEGFVGFSETLREVPSLRRALPVRF
jgi:hypothetical protein